MSTVNNVFRTQIAHYNEINMIGVSNTSNKITSYSFLNRPTTNYHPQQSHRMNNGPHSMHQNRSNFHSAQITANNAFNSAGHNHNNNRIYNAQPQSVNVKQLSMPSTNEMETVPVLVRSINENSEQNQMQANLEVVPIVEHSAKPVLMNIDIPHCDEQQTKDKTIPLPKPKTPICLINELSRYHHVSWFDYCFLIKFDNLCFYSFSA